MLRVFLVLDDYNELVYLETVLKKIGFDVEGLQNPRKYFDISLGFNPQILIVTARGRKVDGLQLAKSISRPRGIPKIVALKPPGQLVSGAEVEEAGVDSVLDTPVNIKKLLSTLSELGELDEKALHDKFAKLKASGLAVDAEGAPTRRDEAGIETPDIKTIKQDLDKLVGKKPAQAQNSNAEGESPAPEVSPVQLAMPDAVANKKRHEAFQKWANKVGKLKPSQFPRDRILEFNKRLRSVPLPDDAEDIERERHKFVETLFTKKKS